MATKTVKGPGSPLGLFSDYSNYGSEFFIEIREKEQNRLEITSDGQLYMTIAGRGDSKFLYDNQGAVILNIRNKTLNFGGEYQVFDADTDKLPLLTIKNKLSLGGPRMVVNFVNFDEEPIELQVRGKLLNNKGKITLNNEPIARFEGGIPEAIADEPNKSGTVSKITIAPLVDVSVAVVIFACLQDISSKD